MRSDNIEIFKDTARLCQTDDVLVDAVEKATAAQELILEGSDVPVQEKKRYQESANVVISKKRTLEAAAGYRGQKVAVLNFASASQPGGGVVTGASAQEECICRCSGLYFSLNTQAMWDGFYRPHREAHQMLHTDDIIYTPQVKVFKTDSSAPQLMPKEQWYDVDVITCAAPNLRHAEERRHTEASKRRSCDAALLALHEKRLRRILEVAVSKGCETIILGAFGCGAFMNDPEIVALANRNVLREYVYAFQNIEYAVYCTPEHERNYRVFQRLLQIYQKGSK
ncbi:MAG: TIGR02452 family protein [Lachnospiraceae bacterium]|nr:TIGR02452 family protein [Lachnospiraceae bacterium]